MQKFHANTYEDTSPTYTTNLIAVGITWADPNGSTDVVSYKYCPMILWLKNVTKVICLHGNDAASSYKEWYFIEAIVPIVYLTSCKHFSTKPWNIASLITLHIHVWTNQILFHSDTVERETFDGENFHGSAAIEDFKEKTFAECQINRIVRCGMPNTLWENFGGWDSNCETRESILSLKFPTVGYWVIRKIVNRSCKHLQTRVVSYENY